MAGQLFTVGEQKIQPGVFLRLTNIGEPAVQVGAQGIAAAAIKSDWGPVNKAVTLESLNDVTPNFGDGKGSEVLRNLFRGGSRRVLAVRVGVGGTPAEITLKDDANADVVKLETKYPTSRQFKVTVRDALTASQRELLVFVGSTLLETIAFTKGDNEPAALMDAVNSWSLYLKAEKLADGSGKLAAVTDQQLTGGTDPNVTGENYVNGFDLFNAEDWNILVVDSEDPTIHAAAHAYLRRVFAEGKRVLGVFGEPTTVDFNTRIQNAVSFNDPLVLYVGSGYVVGTEKFEGAQAAARLAGEILRTPYNASLTRHVIQGAVDVVEKLTNAQIEKAIQSGMIVFTKSPRGQVRVEYGITTFTQPTAELDEGWKKIRRVRTRYELLDRIALTLDPYVGDLDNSPDGRAFVVSLMNGIIQDMVSEGGLQGGQAYEDPTNPPKGDIAYFVVEVDDLDSLEKLYITFGFRFAPVTA